MKPTRLPLRRADLDAGTVPVPADWPLDAATVVLDHRARGVAPMRVEGTLTELAWPDDLHPGTWLTLTWRPARAQLHIRTTVLDDPMRIDGIAYYHDYDPPTVTTDVPEGPSNRAKVLHAVRRLGHVHADGSAVYPEADLLTKAGLGRGTRGAFLLRNAVDQLIREGFVTRVTGTLDATGRPHYPSSPGDTTVDLLFYAPLTEPAAHPDEPTDGDPADRRDHWVKGFLRKLPAGARPSPRSLALYQRAIDNDQVPDEPLVPGYTYVQKHHRH